MARLLEDRPGCAEMTGAGTAIGTADYVAPEQVSDSHTADIRADIYSLGCTLYKLLAGRPPFVGPQYRSPLAKMSAHLRDTPPAIGLLRTDVSPGLAAIIERMMAKERASRFATPQEVAEALAPFAAGADLGRLAQESADMAAGLTEAEQPSLGTDPVISSALTGTTPSESSPLAPREDKQRGEELKHAAESAACHLAERDDDNVAPAPTPAAARSSGGRRIVIALATVAAAVPLLWGVWVIIRNKEGKEVGRFQVPQGGSADLVDDQGQPVKSQQAPTEQPKPVPAEKPAKEAASKPSSEAPVPIPAEKPPTETGPVSLRPIATVTPSVPLKGVTSWTVAMKPLPQGVTPELRVPVLRLENKEQVILSPFVGHSGRIA